MGKYDLRYTNDINDWDAEKLSFLSAIANELAEANRLKRLELLHKILPVSPFVKTKERAELQKKQDEYIRAVSEDQA